MKAKAAARGRLRPEDQKLLEELVRDLEWTLSEIVLEGLRLVREAHPAAHRIIGTGKFAGPGDLSTNKKYMEGFGR